MREIEAGGLDAIVITASGCGTTIKDYGFMLRDDPAYAEKAARVSALAKDITECARDPRAGRRRSGRLARPIAYHSACSMQHGQKITDVPKAPAPGGGLRGQGRARGPYLLRLGRHLQPAPARTRRAAARPQGRQYREPAPAVVATGNIGCMTQIGAARRSRSCIRWSCSIGRRAARAARLGHPGGTRGPPSPRPRAGGDPQPARGRRSAAGAAQLRPAPCRALPGSAAGRPAGCR